MLERAWSGLLPPKGFMQIFNLSREINLSNEWYSLLKVQPYFGILILITFSVLISNNMAKACKWSKSPLLEEIIILPHWLQLERTCGIIVQSGPYYQACVFFDTNSRDDTLFEIFLHKDTSSWSMLRKKMQLIFHADMLVEYPCRGAEPTLGWHCWNRCRWCSIVVKIYCFICWALMEL